MTVRYNVISYLIGEGLRNVFKNKKSTVSALTVMCLCMLVFGMFFMIGENIDYTVKSIEKEQGIAVMLNLNVSTERVQEIGTQLSQIQGINTIDYASKEDALNIMKEELGEAAWTLDALEAEAFPDSYNITLTNLELNGQVQEQIRQIVGEDLDEIRSSNDTIETLIGIGKGIRISTFILLAILVVISIVIISNTIKLTVHARRKEISIMKYVGATNSFIRWPFIIEGITIGLVSALITILIVGLVYNTAVTNLLNIDLIKSLGMSFVSFADMFNLMLSVYMILGIGIGIVGSSISMRKYLEV